MLKIAELKNHFPKKGTVEWIGVRSRRDHALTVINTVLAIQDHGLEGDRSSKSCGGRRQVTLFQAEYLSVLNLLNSGSTISYEALRRNIVVSGINLNALINQTINIGQSIFEITGFCHPCSKMEKLFGEGAYNVLRGHGGLTAKIIKSGEIAVGNNVEVLLAN
ncbi:MAG: MOSC domain-containing protein [Pseudomonadota bacterium]